MKELVCSQILTFEHKKVNVDHICIFQHQSKRRFHEKTFITTESSRQDVGFSLSSCIGLRYFFYI